MAEVPTDYSSLHNLLYLPDQTVLVCNGLSERPQASCHQWSPANSSWQLHSAPNKPQQLLLSLCGHSRLGYEPGECKLVDKGRYAAQMVQQSGDTLIIGGMVYDREGHQATDSVRRFSPAGRTQDWTESRTKLSKVRAFACAVATRAGRIAVLGGHTEIGGALERSGELLGSRGGHGRLPDMLQPRSGHGCVEVQGGLVVAGGTRGHRDHATRQAEQLR